MNKSNLPDGKNIFPSSMSIKKQQQFSDFINKEIQFNPAGKALGHKEVLTAHRKIIQDKITQPAGVGGGYHHYSLTLADETTEFEFFKLIVLCVIVE